MPEILLASTYALASIYHSVERGEIPKSDEGLEYYSHARKLVNDYTDSRSPLVVFALFLLITYSTFSGKCSCFPAFLVIEKYYCILTL
jgi:hypothetical protein